MNYRQKQWQDAFPDPTEHYHRKVEATLASLPGEKENRIMKMNKKIAVPVMALLMIFVFGTGLIATGTLDALLGSSPAEPDYTVVPTAEELEKDLGFASAVPDALAGDYVFEEAVIGKVRGKDENGNTLLKQKFLNCKYSNESDSLVLYIQEDNILLEKTGELAAECNGTDIYYQQDIYKRLPVGYEMTEQDRLDEANGTYIFSEGETDHVFTEEISHVTWVAEGIFYDLMATDTELTKDQMIAAAEMMLVK